MFGQSKLSWVVVLFAAACGSVSKDKPDANVAGDDAPVDSAGTVDAAVDAFVPFLPTQLTGLAMWLDAGQNVTGTSSVSAWGDSSSRNNNAQANLTYAPSRIPNVINGRPVLRFYGNGSLQVADSATLQFGTEDFLIALVAGYTNSTSTGLGYGMFFAKQAVPYPYTGPSMWGNYTQPSLSTRVAFQVASNATGYAQTTADGQNNGAIRLYVARRYGGTNLEMRVNGVASGTGTTPSALDVSATGLPLYIGGVVSGNDVNQALEGDIAEIVLVRGAMSMTQIVQLETYLKTKYAL